MLYYQFHVICHTARDNFGYQCYVAVGGWGTVAKNYFDELGIILEGRNYLQKVNPHS
jgi:hypothetical protein